MHTLAILMFNFWFYASSSCSFPVSTIELFCACADVRLLRSLGVPISQEISLVEKLPHHHTNGKAGGYYVPVCFCKHYRLKLLKFRLIS